MIGLLRRLLDRAGRVQLTLLLAGATAGAILQGLAFALLVPVVGALLEGDQGSAWLWLGVLAVVFGLHTLVLLRTADLGVNLGIGVLRTVHRRVGDHVAALPLAWFGPERTGLLGRMAGQGSIDVAVAPVRLVTLLVTAVVTPLTVTLVMLLIDWRLGVALLLSAPVVFAGSQALAFMVGRSEGADHAATAEASGRVVEFARTQPVLRAAGRAVEGNRLVENALQEQRAAGRRMVVGGSAGMTLFLFVLQAVLSGVLALGVYLALDGSIGIAELIALLVLSARFVDPLINAAGLSGSLRIATEALRRVVTLLETPPLPEPERPVQPGQPSIELDQVSFGYGAQPVLQDVSFTVPARSMTALVGVSGSGKTTVTRLVARFADVEAGTVRVAGQDVRELGTAGVLSQVSMVFQDVYLFDDTLRNNIRVGRPEASDDDITRVARLARVDEMIERLPRGWDTPVGEGGAALSGGERQRISIARALLKDAPIVLLDEATAALDPENEAAVQDALAALTADRTLLVIAHRLQTIAAADQIVVLDAGRVVEVGRHEELLAAGGRYAGFWSQRERAAGWRLAPTPSPS